VDSTLAIGAVRMSGIFTINFADFTYEATPTSIWSVTEIGTAIIVASSPIIRPLFDRVFHSIVSSARTNNRYTYNNNSNNQTLKSITKASGFDRLGGEEIPLQDIERGGVVATVTAGTPSASTKSVEDFHSYMSTDVITKEEQFDSKIHVKVDTTFYQSDESEGPQK
jgi:hypothetical protein